MSSTAIDTCANCSKEGGDGLKSCGACKLVKYCSRECQISHRPMHKKACKKRVAELYDEKLFKEPEPEECPICMLILPLDNRQIQFQSCCGKLICHGCIQGMVESEGRPDLCAYCRTPHGSSDEEHLKRVNKLIENGNANAFNDLACLYGRGARGLPQDWIKANELYLKAGELGCADGYFNIGNSHFVGRGVELDRKKAKYYLELAAMGGDVQARNNLGCLEWNIVAAKGGSNYQRSMKHFIIAAKAGDKSSLDEVKKGCGEDEYASTLQAFQKRQNEMKSEMREKAKTHNEARAAARGDRFVDEVAF